jgi:phosphate starvation-inducible PhoH-like protein
LSAKRNLKPSRRSRYPELDEAANVQLFHIPARKQARKTLEPKTEHQREYMQAMRTSTITIGAGPAGTGKTIAAAYFAAEKFLDKDVEQIILVRPAVESGQTLGLLPGTLEEKYAVYLAPIREYLIDVLGKTQYEYALKAEQILPQPLGYMRGSTFSNCVVILDEAQNVTPAEMKMFLTRIGENCTVIINGDVEQCDLKGDCGLEDAIERIEFVEGVTVVEFDEDDCLRSPIVKAILKTYRY